MKESEHYQYIGLAVKGNFIGLQGQWDVSSAAVGRIVDS